MSIPRGQETRGKTTGSEQGKTQAVDVGMKKDRDLFSVVKASLKLGLCSLGSGWGTAVGPGEIGCARLVQKFSVRTTAADCILAENPLLLLQAPLSMA